MKFTLTLCALLLCSTIFSQEAKKNPASFYVSSGVQIGNGDNFQSSSFPSVEMGISLKNFSLGLSAGTSSFEKHAPAFYEPKISFNAPLGPVRGYIMFGVGSYFNTSKTFIEYGGGVLLKAGPGDIFIQLTNWDKLNYLGLGYSITL